MTNQFPPMLQRGATGAEVEKLQQDLLRLGYSLGTTGTFDDETETAILQFQKDRALTADGKVGPETGRALDVALA
jgi:peptidoglycan hydrolase-like protein with peptidoglycan-binding domain